MGPEAATTILKRTYPYIEYECLHLLHSTKFSPNVMIDYEQI